MLDAAREAMKSAKQYTRADLEKNRVWTLGIVKCVEIIGEAAGRVSEGTKEKHPRIPWLQMVATLNRLVHAYFDIDLDQVWMAVTEDLPPVVVELKRALKAEGER